MVRRNIVFVYLVLMFSACLLAGFPASKGQYTPGGAGCPLVGSIDITSPSNTTYSSSGVMLNISVNGLLSSAIYNYDVVYSIDGNGNLTLPVTVSFVPVRATDTYANGTTATVTSSFFSYYAITGNVELSSLSDGAHCLMVYADYVRFNSSDGNWPALIYDSSTVNFTVNDGVSPVIANLSIANGTYNINNLTLSFTSDKLTSWEGYSLDGGENQTITGNTTLTSLANGSHNLIVYANDTVGNMGASGVVNFNVDLPSAKLSTATLSTAEVAASISAAVLAILCFAFFKKHSYLKIKKKN